MSDSDNDSDSDGGTPIILTASEVREKLQCSSPDFLAMREHKGFPSPDVVKGNLLLWLPSTVDGWIRDNDYKPRTIVTRTRRQERKINPQ